MSSKHRVVLVWVFATVVGAVGFALSRPVVLVNDGIVYMEMARSMTHGSFELQNGLDVVDSPELWIYQSVKIGPHLYGRYPPFFGVLAALPYALLHVHGLHLLNAICLGLTVLGTYALARRLLDEDRALWATALLPVAVPLLPYVVAELPHLVSGAPVLWAIVCWDAAVHARDARRAALWALLSGVLVGLASGVRVQAVVVAVPLLALGAVHAPRRGPLLGGMAAGLGACLGLLAAINEHRFGQANPFSYGPANADLGAPDPVESAALFAKWPVLVALALFLGPLVLARALRRPRLLGPAYLSAIAIAVAAPPVRKAAVGMVECTAELLLDANAAHGWDSPIFTHGWLDKALLVASPMLILGLVGAVAVVVRRASPLATALGWIVLAMLAFLAPRDPDTSSGVSVMGFFSLTPRLLVDVMPPIYLLGWAQLAKVRFDRGAIAACVTGAAAGLGTLAFLWVNGPGDERYPIKLAFLSNVPVAVAFAIAALHAARRMPHAPMALGLLLGSAVGYAGASTAAEDVRAFRAFGEIQERWGKRVMEAMPDSIALVGWHFAKDGVAHVRDHRRVVTVDPWADHGLSLVTTLDALRAKGFEPYFFGIFLDDALAHADGRYRAEKVLDDPLLYKLVPANR